MLPRTAPSKQAAASASHMSSPSSPSAASRTPLRAPPPTPVTPRKCKASELDEAISQPQAKARAKPDLLRKSREEDAQRTAQLKFIMQEGIGKGERGRSKEETKAREVEIARVPVNVRIEHCVFQRQPGNTPRLGNVRRSIQKDASIWTLHAPLLGYEGTTFQQLYSRLRVVYLEEFAAMHRGHTHPSQKDGDIIGEVRLKLSAHDPGRIINEQNWQEALALLLAQQLPCSHMGEVYGKACLSTIVASFSCPRSA